jgi:hypothetical protein
MHKKIQQCRQAPDHVSIWKERDIQEFILTKQKTYLLFKSASKALTDTKNIATLLLKYILPNHKKRVPPVKPENRRETLETQVLQITQKSVMVQSQ